MLLEILFDDSSKFSDQLKHANFQKTIKKSVVTFKKGDDKIFGKEIIKCFLLDSTFSHLLRSELILDMMCNFIRPAVKFKLNVKLVLEHVMRSVHIKR